jgi:hypothetical protein
MIDPEEAARALREAKGSVGKAARSLDVKSADLRRFLSDSPTVWAAALEAAERDLDKAERILLDGMDSRDKLKRLETAALILKSGFRGRR